MCPIGDRLFLYSYEVDFVQHLQKSKFKKQKTSCGLTFRYIYDVLSLNNPRFNDYFDVVHPKELESRDTADAPEWSNYLDLHLEFDGDGKLLTRLYDFDFSVVNFPY